MDLLRVRYPPLVEPNRHGRNGQSQDGVDFVLAREDGVHGYQSKRVEKMTLKVVQEELRKAGSFPVPLASFTVLTSAPLDAPLQGEVLNLSRERTASGLFPVTVVFWPSLKSMLAEFPNILEKYYPHLEVEPTVLLEARNRRIDREFPGTHLEFRHTPGATEVTVHAGPGGFPFKVRLDGEDVIERFRAAATLGEAAEFSDAEFSLELPEVLSIGRRGATGRRTLTVTPSLNDRTTRVRVVVCPLRRFRNEKEFLRRMRRERERHAGEWTVERFGSERIVERLSFDDLPIELVLTRRLVDGEWTTDGEILRAYVGVPVERAAEAERLVQVIAGGAWIGAFTDEHTVFSLRCSEEEGSPGRLMAALEVLEELVKHTDWELSFPDRLLELDVGRVESLVHLFRDGRRVLGSAGEVTVGVDTEQLRDHFLDMIANHVPPLTATLAQAPREIELLGKTFEKPATLVRLRPLSLPEDCRERLKCEDLPVLIRVKVLEGGLIVEELISGSDEDT